MAKFKPNKLCPKCNGPDFLEEFQGGYYLSCCECGYKTKWSSTKKGARYNWNNDITKEKNNG